jgi:hypothetical protein
MFCANLRAPQEFRGGCDRLLQADALDRDAFRKGGQESGRHRLVQQHENAAVVGPADETAEMRRMQASNGRTR